MADAKETRAALVALLVATNAALERHQAVPDVTAAEAQGLTIHALRIVVDASGERLASLVALGR